MGVPKEGAHLGVHLRLPELVQVPEKLQDVGAAAAVESQRRTMVPQVLPEGVPVAPLLRLVTARRLHRLRHNRYLPAEQAGFVAGAATVSRVAPTPRVRRPRSYSRGHAAGANSNQQYHTIQDFNTAKLRCFEDLRQCKEKRGRKR